MSLPQNRGDEKGRAHHAMGGASLRKMNRDLDPLLGSRRQRIAWKGGSKWIRSTLKRRPWALWIDRRKAVIVFLDGVDEETRVIQSNVKRYVRSSGGSRSKSPYGPQDVSAEVKRERKYAEYVGRYYDEVIASIRDAESILIFGPGEAKAEFRKALGAKRLGERIAGFETVDKMSDRQMAAKVRQYFLE